MTAEELAIKYGFYRWSEEGKCYICSPNFLADVDKVIVAQQRSFVAMYMIMRNCLIKNLKR